VNDIRPLGFLQIQFGRQFGHVETSWRDVELCRKFGDLVSPSASLRNSADLEHSRNPMGFRTGRAEGTAQKFHAYISIDPRCCCCAAQSRSTRLDTTDHRHCLPTPTTI